MKFGSTERQARDWPLLPASVPRPKRQRKTHDENGFPIYDGPEHRSETMKQIDAEKKASADWKIEQVARRMRNTIDLARKRREDREERERQAAVDLEEHIKQLAKDAAWERSRWRPNPWLNPWDAGYQSAEELEMLRRADERRQAEQRPRPAPRSVRSGHIDAMVSDMAAMLGKSGSPARKATPARRRRHTSARGGDDLGSRRTDEPGLMVPSTWLLQKLASMTEEEARSQGPRVVEARRRALKGADTLTRITRGRVEWR